MIIACPASLYLYINKPYQIHAYPWSGLEWIDPVTADCARWEYERSRKRLVFLHYDDLAICGERYSPFLFAVYDWLRVEVQLMRRRVAAPMGPRLYLKASRARRKTSLALALSDSFLTWRMLPFASKIQAEVSVDIYSIGYKIRLSDSACFNFLIKVERYINSLVLCNLQMFTIYEGYWYWRGWWFGLKLINKFLYSIVSL